MVRSIVVACRGSGSGMRQGVVRVARVRCVRDAGRVKVVGGCGGVAWGGIVVTAAGGGTRQGVVRVARDGAGDESLLSMGHITPVTPA